MKRLAALALAVALFPLLLKGESADTEDFVKDQYQAFEREQGRKAYQIALSITDSIGVPARFDENSDKKEVKSELLKQILLYYNMTGELDKQLEFMRIAQPFYHETNNLMDLAGCYHTMGVSYQRMGHFNEAIRYYNLCSELLDEVGGPIAMTNKRYELNNMANIYTMMEECDLAEKMFLTCIEMLGEVGENQRENLDLSSYYMNLAEVKLIRLSKLGPNDPGGEELLKEAMDYAERSLDISRRFGDSPEKLANRYITLSKTHFEAERHQEALAEIDSAMAIIQEQKLVFLEAEVLVLKGEFAYRMGRNDEAEQYCVKAVEMGEAYHFDDCCIEGLKCAYLATKERHPERSIGYLEQYKALEDSLFNQEQQAMIREYQVKYQTAEKEREIAVKQAENQRNSHRIISLIVIASLFAGFNIVLFLLLRKRRKQNNYLKRRTQIKDQLFSVVSHDIKTPVEFQSQMLDMMCVHADTMKPADLKEGLESMKKATDELKDKLLNLLFWVKGELGDKESHPTMFNLYEMTRNVVSDHISQANLKSVSITNEVPMDWECFDDANIVRMVMQNLLSNAVKFSKPGGDIRLTAVEQGERYRFSVADQGVGIDEAKLAKLLKEMTMPGKGTGGETGTGIGLFVSRQMMDRIGGEMEVESVVNKGTTVSFTINKA